ncbi:MAG: DUF2490 domain-containing protein [Moheibacter sp.]
MKQLFTVLLSLICCLGIKAQESDFGNWWIVFNNVTIKNSKFNWHSEIQYRNYNMVGDLEQLLLRTGIGYNISENNNNILLGYGFIQSENYPSNSKDKNDKVNVSEHRIYQQFITKQNFSRWYLQHRYRFEQRFIETDFKLRFRYFLAFNVALSKPKLEDKTWYASAYNEIFLNTEETVFDRNRIYGGIGYKLNKNIKFEFGYMNQFLNGFSRDQLNIITSLNF